MLLTTSKNLKKEYKKIAKIFSNSIYGLSYASRKDRALQELSSFALKNNHLSIGVFSVFEQKFLIKKYFYNPKLGFFEWEKKFLLIWNLKFTEKKVFFDSPIRLKIIGGKDLAKFFDLSSDPLSEILGENIFKIKVSKNLAEFFYNQRKIFSMNFVFLEGIKNV